MGFADVEIYIRQKDDTHYPVEITVDSEREFLHGQLDADLEKQPARPTDVHYAAQYGQELFEWFFTDTTLAKHWSEIRGAYPQRRVRLRIDAYAPELHQVPWEAFCEPNTEDQPALQLAAHSATPFSRYLAGKTWPGKPILSRPVRILMVAPEQDDFSQQYIDPDMVLIDPNAEYQALRKAIQPLLDKQTIRLDLMPPPCTLAKIVDILSAARAKGEGYHILHFVCHGFYDKGKVRLVLADTNNHVEEVLDDTIVTSLAQQLMDGAGSGEDTLRLIFLASCESAKRSSADAYRGLAPKLVTAGVPAVVAMQDQVGQETARAFATKFYSQLLQHGQVDLAANEARQVIMAADLPGPVIPVLFLRLRTGNLLGQRGKIYSQSGQSFWPFLLDNIEKGLCTVFIGPHLNDRLLPAPETLAERLAEKYGYPLKDRTNLARVAQYVALTDPEQLHSTYLGALVESLPRLLGRQLTDQEKKVLRKKKLSQVVDDLDWATSVRTVYENEPYHLLAELPIGLYITTNVDSFMVTALKKVKPKARREQPRWEQTTAQSPQYALWLGDQKDDPAFREENPVVFHLNGYDTDSNHLVLSEDDFMAHLVRLARDQDTMLPTDVLGALARDSLVFVGFKLDDWEFRSILQGLLKRIAQHQVRKKPHVGVQLDIEQASEKAEDQARQYLERYLGSFNIDIYWGDAQQFVNELHSRWIKYPESGNYDW